VSGSLSGSIRSPVLPLAAAVPVAVAAAAVAVRAGARRP
jgi:hypothetical protein